VSQPAAFLSPTDAARELGVSAKALRLYEERGLLSPSRTQAGWRAYGPAEMTQARKIVALRALGLSLAQVERVLRGDKADRLEATLAAHQSSLEGRLRETSDAIRRVHELRQRIAAGAKPTASELVGLQGEDQIAATLDLPWPWGGERFELRTLKPITYLTGPLFSGKTKLAMLIAETIPGAVFIGLDRTVATSLAAPSPDVERTMAWLIEDGATPSDALSILVNALEAKDPSALVFDLIEQGLDEATQLALMAHLRRRGPGAMPVVLMTRSIAILDLASVRPDEAIILCPANHSPPIYVMPHPGAAGYEATASCLAPPDVRARTEGVIAMRPPAA
jgi:DNA-binding transcriptional MerR regulator